MDKQLIIYPGKELHIHHGERVQRVRIRKTYSTYATCDRDGKIDVISYRELMEAADEAQLVKDEF